ncbi:MAG: hypothetical protein KA024_01110 [Zoogloea sp.]|nr:hypothetical protein [Zoogloea sp.]
MDSNAMVDVTRESLVHALFLMAMSQIEDFGIPVVKGQVRGDAGTLILIPLVDGIAAHRALIGAGSICVIDSKMATADSGEPVLDGFDIRVRLGESSTWLWIVVEALADEDDEALDDDDDDLDPAWESMQQLRTDTWARVAVLAAKSQGFGDLRNQRQRKDLCREIASVEVANVDNLPEPSEWELNSITDDATDLYSLGVLPMAARRLKEEGASVAEIAKRLGISKLKAERALQAITPDAIQNRLVGPSACPYTQLTRFRCVAPEAWRRHP